MQDYIVVKGAREHNLKNITVSLPRNKFVVITGISGSGKSTLAFDTIYAEGQRRYVESLSAYARQFLGQMDKPDVDSIEGLSPAIAIEQKSGSHNPRSTVGTITEIFDYLRLLYARIGIPHCPKCGREIKTQNVDQIVDQILFQPISSKIHILSPLVRGRKGEYRHLFEKARHMGFVRVRVDGKLFDLSGKISLDKNKKHQIEVVVDRLVVKPSERKRLADSVETALKLSEGIVTVEIDGKQTSFSEHFACLYCGTSFEELSPRMFSFNNPYGACPDCSGLGVKMEINPSLVVDFKRSLKEGAILPWNSPTAYYYQQLIQGLAAHYHFRLDIPFGSLKEEFQNIILYGTGSEKVEIRFQKQDKAHEYSMRFEGVVKNLERRYRETQSNYIREEISRFMQELPCPSCKGLRLKQESLAVTVSGLSIIQLTDLSIKRALNFFDNLKLTNRETQIAKQILKEIRERLLFLSNVGLDYLTLSRPAETLAGGESARIHLATQIGSGLMGVLYILDEPSIGLHQRDNERLLKTLHHLRDIGNTVLVVEHDEATIKSADFIVDMGPSAGQMGGNVVVAGNYSEILACDQSISGKYLRRDSFIPVPRPRRKGNGKYLEIRGASENNLKSINVKIPLGTFTCVTGVSGSGKSSLVTETLGPGLIREIYKVKSKPAKYEKILGHENLDKVINIDQSPIGRTPRSNPVTYTGVFDDIRSLFSMLPESKQRGYKPGRFSFNVSGGRCEACEGDGILRIEMHFLPDVYVPCEVCKGKRYNHETLEIRYKDKSIADVLNMTVSEAFEFFRSIPSISKVLSTLQETGLGYIKLGQPATTLSGGEAQRVKLSSELCRKSTGRTFYILDEPTTGLHFADIDRLLQVLFRLVDSGNTVLVIEHNLDVIKTADYLVDLGPEGGEEGGEIIAEGTPEDIVKVKKSYTGSYLKPVLEEGVKLIASMLKN